METQENNRLTIPFETNTCTLYFLHDLSLSLTSLRHLKENNVLCRHPRIMKERDGGSCGQTRRVGQVHVYVLHGVDDFLRLHEAFHVHQLRHRTGGDKMGNTLGSIGGQKSGQ